jgi:hypothetical protein
LAFDAAGIIVPILLWRRLLRELHRRGDGRRESGAFLLRARGAGQGRITRFVCYDDLDPASCQSGAIACERLCRALGVLSREGGRGHRRRAYPSRAAGGPERN